MSSPNESTYCGAERRIQAPGWNPGPTEVMGVLVLAPVLSSQQWLPAILVAGSTQHCTGFWATRPGCLSHTDTSTLADSMNEISPHPMPQASPNFFLKVPACGPLAVPSKGFLFSSLYLGPASWKDGLEVLAPGSQDDNAHREREILMVTHLPGSQDRL